MAGSEFEIRPAKPSEDRYREIMSACFGKAPDARYFAWKYADNPAGEVVGFEAISAGRLAGFYGVIPWYLGLGHKTLRVFQSMDTMTHPSFQRRGLFVKLAQATYAEVEARHKEYVIIGVPGSTSFPGFVQKLGWAHVLDSRYLFKPAFLGKAGSPRGITVRAITDVCADLETYLKRRSGRPDFIQPSLDPVFLDWRVFKNPTTSYQGLLVEAGHDVIGFSVISPMKEGRVSIDLVDCVADDRWNDVVGAISAHIFATQRPSFVYTWKPGDKRRAAAFSRAMFLENPFRRGPFSYRVPFIVRSAVGSIEGLALNAAKSFDLQPLVQD